MLNMYVCSGTVPAPPKQSWRGPASGQVAAHEAAAPHLARPRIRQVAAHEAAAAGPAVAALINAAYAVSDTGITLSTPRVPVEEVVSMIRRGEIWAAQKIDGGAEGGDFVGCIQVMVKGAGGAGEPPEGQPPGGQPQQQPQPQQQGKGKGEGEGGCRRGDDGEVPQNTGLPSAHAGPVGEFTCLAVAASCGGHGLGEALVRAAEAHARRAGCERMVLGVMCPAVAPEHEPEYKVWLQRYYLRLGYDRLPHMELAFKPPRGEGQHNERDELNEMYSCLRQLVPCKAILMDKAL